jgi:endonuclease/exonuclease/phosphatase family metal-dependent hydrolase
MAEEARLRAVTLNLWGEQGPLERRLQLCIEQLRELNPDVVALQEVREIPSKLVNTAQQLGTALGLTLRVCAGHGVGRWHRGAGDPVAAPDHGPRARRAAPASNADERRVLLWAELATPHGVVLVGTTHLHYRMTDGIAREEQVEAIDRLLKGHAQKLAGGPKLTAADGRLQRDPGQ